MTKNNKSKSNLDSSRKDESKLEVDNTNASVITTEDKKAIIKTNEKPIIETKKGDLINPISLTKDPTFLNSSCQDCLCWSPSKSSEGVGICRGTIPSVHSGKIYSEGPLYIYPLTLNTLPACTHFKTKH